MTTSAPDPDLEIVPLSPAVGAERFDNCSFMTGFAWNWKCGAMHAPRQET